MSKILLGKSHGQAVFLDIEILLRTRLLVQANSGGGKSYLLRRLAEQLFGKIPVIIIDPEGEFATLREKFGYVLVGKGGETPADPRSAALVAQKLLELRASAVCDLYEMKPSDRHHWVRLFLESLIDAPKRLWRPTIIIVDEAHLFAPQKGTGESEAHSAMVSMPTRGRKRRFCPIWATQRLAKVDKDASAELLNRLIGPTFEDVDLKRAADLLSILPEDRRKFDQEMRVLEPGHFYALGRAICTERKLVSIGKVLTSHEIEDSKYGIEPPPAPEKVKALLPKLADLPKQAEEKARTEADLRSEIRSLQAQLRSRPKEIQKPSGIDPNEARKMVQGVENHYKKELQRVQEQTAKLLRGILAISDLAQKLLGEKLIHTAQMANLTKMIPSTPKAAFTPPIHVTIKPTLPPPSETNIKIGGGARRLLTAAVQWHPNGLREGHWRSLAGLKDSGTYSTYKSSLRAAGLIEIRNGLVFATEQGIEFLGSDVSPAPQTTDEVLRLWTSKLGRGARRMLDILIQHNGNPLSKEELAASASMSNSGTFSTYLAQLKTAQLITVEQGAVSANKETLFLG